MNIKLSKTKSIWDKVRIAGGDDFETIEVNCDETEFDKALEVLKKFEKN
jgi:hypothetical protein